MFDRVDLRLTTTRRRCTLLVSLAASLPLAASSALGAPTTLLDDFRSYQRVPAGAEAVGWAAGEAILGGERELTVTAGSTHIVWDGPDATAELDASGLGGVDLRGGLTLEVDRPGPAIVRIQAWSDEARASVLTLPLADDQRALSFDLADATPHVGAGVDLAAVGALIVTIDRPLRPLALRLDRPAPTPATFQRGPTPISINVLALDGDVAPGAGGGTIITLNPPFTDGFGRAGFVGAVDAGGSTVNFVWFDDQVVWRNTDAIGMTLTGGESVMGIADDGSFNYSPSTDGDDSVWTDSGLLAVENTPAPDQPAPTASTFHSRPQMDDDGTAYWVAGLNPSGGTSTEARAFYEADDGLTANITTVFQSGDMIDGFTLSSGSSGVDFDYDMSSDGDHRIHALDMATGSTADDLFIYVDGSLVAQESTPNGSGDNWDNFDQMSINAFGDHLWSGDTDGPTATDEYIAYNGTIVVREGDVIDGVTLASTASVRAVSINDRSEAIHAWNVSGGVEHIFFASDASDLPGSSTRILSTGDSVDVDGDSIGDATVTDLNTFGPSIEFSIDGRVLLEVDLDFGGGGGDQEAVIALAVPRGDVLVINEVNYDDGASDTLEFVEIFNAGTNTIDLDPYTLEAVDGAGSAYSTIDLPAVMLAPGDFYVVCGDAAAVFNCDLDTPPATDWLQDAGPAAVALALGGGVVDTVSYEGDAAAPYTEDVGAAGDDGSVANAGLSRLGDGIDSNQNDRDFGLRCGSPGAANLDTDSGCAPIPVELTRFTVD
ncbi:MAG: lamin tail domain-containing protein [Acidobacteriota bacterium]